MPVIASKKFWGRVRAIAGTQVEPKKTRAEYLAAYEQGAAAGGRNREKVYREHLSRKYRENQSSS